MLTNLKAWFLKGTVYKIAAIFAVCFIGGAIARAYSISSWKNIEEEIQDPITIAATHEHTINVIFKSNDDGTHTLTSYCTDEDGLKCDYDKTEKIKECTYDNETFKCTVCGSHEQITVTFKSSIDDSIIGTTKIDKGSSLTEDDYVEAPEVEGYTLVEKLSYENAMDDITIYYVYEGSSSSIIGEEPVISEYANATYKDPETIDNSSISNNSNNTDNLTKKGTILDQDGNPTNRVDVDDSVNDYLLNNVLTGVDKEKYKYFYFMIGDNGHWFAVTNTGLEIMYNNIEQFIITYDTNFERHNDVFYYYRP